ncbi:hypothetical protein FRC00_001539 [Tulasnella sp. 408]|nr:hypothetical protein FRC00_001539 [Tulasnella sp. 408]
MTTFNSSHEPRTDVEPSLGVKPWSANVADNPPNAFNFIVSHSQSPQNITAGNHDPSYHVNSDGMDLVLNFAALISIAATPSRPYNEKYPENP